MRMAEWFNNTKYGEEFYELWSRGGGMSSSLIRYAELQADDVGVILGPTPCSHAEVGITLAGCMRRRLRIAYSAFRTCITQ